MADALCGPSNALQNFQKHTTVDRTLQQDRLTSRQSPSHGFRSSPGPNAGLLDAEFNAFEAGPAAPPQLHPSFHPPPPALAPQFAQAPQAPNWASDFQRLSLGPTHAPPLQQHRSAQPTNAASAWHQDFLNQSTPQAQAPMQQYHGFGGMGTHNMSWGPSAFQGLQEPQMASKGLGKERAQEHFDEAAFERAFEEAHRDALEANLLSHEPSATSNSELRVSELQSTLEDLNSAATLEDNPLLRQILDTRPAVYYALKTKNELDLGRTDEAQQMLTKLQGLLQVQARDVSKLDLSEAVWCVNALQRMVERNISSEITSQAEALVMELNQKLMSEAPLGSTGQMIIIDEVKIGDELGAIITGAKQGPLYEAHLQSSGLLSDEINMREEFKAAGYTTSTLHPEQVHQQPEQVYQQPEQEKQEPHRNEDDEMARTAGELLNRVADNTSAKFQNSQFFELMRRLRDHEVRVEGDKMVDVSNTQSSTAPLSAADTAPVGIDPNILDHAATDFEMPVDSELEHETNSATTTLMHPITNETIPPHEQDLDLGRSGTMHGHHRTVS